MKRLLSTSISLQLRFIVLLTGMTLVLALSAQQALADSLEARFSFVKSTPSTGVMYVVKDEVPRVSLAIDQKNKQFTRIITVGTPGSTITFLNNDSQDHNIFANDPNSGAKFDVGLIEPGAESNISMDWNGKSLTRLGCKIHPKMKAYVANIPSDKFVSLEFQKGKQDHIFVLKKVDSQNKTIVVQLPSYDVVGLEIEKGQEIHRDLVRKGKLRGAVRVRRF